MELPLVLTVPSGVISAIYFFALELVLERAIFSMTTYMSQAGAVFDVVVGKKKEFSESKLPVLGEGLLTFHPRHRFLYLYRLLFLICIFLVNIGTDGSVRDVDIERRGDYIAVPQATNEDWARVGIYSFERNFGLFTTCRRPTKDGYTFFQMTVNLQNGKKYLSDFTTDQSKWTAMYNIIQEAVYCLDGINFKPESPALTLTNCGLGASLCLVRTSYGRIPEAYQQYVSMDNVTQGKISKQFLMGKDIFGLRNKEYEWLCIRSKVGVWSECVRWKKVQNKTLMRIESTVIGQIAQNSNFSVVFEYYTPEATVVGGSFGSISIAKALRGLDGFAAINIVDLVSNIFAHSVQYRTYNGRVFEKTGTRPVTEVNQLAIIGFAGSGILTVLAMAFGLFLKQRTNKLPVAPSEFSANGLSRILHRIIEGRTMQEGDSGRANVMLVEQEDAETTLQAVPASLPIVETAVAKVESHDDRTSQ